VMTGSLPPPGDAGQATPRRRSRALSAGVKAAVPPRRS
jgi:hypothetical protein